MIYLHKLLPLLLSPIVLVCALVLAGLWWKRRWLALAGVALLWLCASPWFSDALFRAVEQQAVRQSPAAVPQADAVVVLSGMLTTVPGAQGTAQEWSDPDRFFAGLELFAAGKAPKLVFTRGKLPWSVGEQAEGDVLRQWAEKQGVPPHAIVLTGLVENTQQEAAEVRRLFPSSETTVLLVTSAFHMPRAQALFAAQGLRVVPYPVDFKVLVRQTTLMDFLPDADALRWTDVAVRELIGRGYYWLRG